MESKLPPKKSDLYVYRVRLVRCVDGDTVLLSLDLGCEVWLRNQHCRLIGINAPETHTHTKEAGDAATWHLRGLLSQAVDLLVRTHYDKRGSFRRLLVELYADDVNINQQMIKDGHAVEMG